MGNNKGDQIQLGRKARRKQERKARKQKRAPKAVAPPPAAPKPPDHLQSTKDEKLARRSLGSSHPPKDLPGANKRQKLKHKRFDSGKDDPYAGVDPAMAAAMRRDDQEIAELEIKLGLSSAKNKAKLNREYAKLEGYGDDFGDFLEGLDDMVRRVSRGSTEGDGYYQKDPQSSESETDQEDREGNDESSLESPYKSDQEEFDNGGAEEELLNDSEEESMEEEEIPMKDPAYSDEENRNDPQPESDDQSDDNDNVATDERNARTQANDHENDTYNAESSSEDEDKDEPDHDKQDTYQPIKGEDIYGNVRRTAGNVSLGKYVPPHLRQKRVESSQDREESLRVIQRLLNASLNRLSEGTLLSVAQSIGKLYDSHPKADMNESIWKITRNTCVERSVLMTGLTPVYMAALIGVHHVNPGAQLAEHLIELATTELYAELHKHLDGPKNDAEEVEHSSKRACNLALVLCYLYNYGVVHCSLLYDFIRKLIENFHEVDVEVLLIFLSHSGRALRSDDPLALKEIVFEVQKRATEETSSSSRVDYMLSAMMDLKNNKRRPQDVAFADATSRLRKSIGHIKSKVATTDGKANDNSLRITLNDVLAAESNGRWWRVGASWAGNQYKYHDGDEGASNGSQNGTKAAARALSLEADEKLLKLAAKYRMNTDTRRSIFCIIMGAADCDDAFEKIVRAGVLKNKSERDVVRVLMECCGNEKVYNKFYEHLASRICEFQNRCRFTFQLAFWDIFKQLHDMKLRKAANLAKLLFSLVVQHQILKLNVLKAIDMTALEDLSETATIFLTIFFTNTMEYFGDETAVSAFFQSAIHNGQGRNDEDVIGQTDEAEALRANFTLFFVQVLKSSPKYKKGSHFRSNLKAAIKACDTDNFF